MSNPLRTLEDYELFLYSLKEEFKSIRRSTVIVSRRGAFLARVSGELQFDHGIRFIIRERILYHRLPAVIDEYGYEVWDAKEKLFWYDAQPHPDDLTLQRHIPIINILGQTLKIIASQHRGIVLTTPISLGLSAKSKTSSRR